MMEWLDILLEHKVVRSIDVQFCRFITAHEAEHGACEEVDESFALLCLLVSVALGQQHSCLSLEEIEQSDPLAIGALHQQLGLPELEHSLAKLADYHCISDGDPEHYHATTPLVLYGEHLYLQRYWVYEASLAQRLKGKLRTPQSSVLTAMGADIRRWFDELFVFSKPGELDWQKMACVSALVNDFCVITGGPGTGKTTTVTNLLALLVLIEAHGGSDKSGIIKLATPTGKAAARLSESIKGAKEKLALTQALKDKIPDEASTIHRLLGVKPHSSEFMHHQDNLLHLDVLVVDEVSMVDLPMMAKLLSALPAHCKLILLGDKDQLASVEAGSVLADICQSIAQGLVYSRALVAQVGQLTGMDIGCHCQLTEQGGINDAICLLQHSHRFDDKSGIGQLAKAVNRCDWHGVRFLSKKDDSALHFAGISEYDKQQLVLACVKAYQPYIQLIREGASAELVIKQFNQFQLLCALREGEHGVSGMNKAIETQLHNMGLIDSSSLYYVGKPIMISHNDYSLNLFNGDVGLFLPDPQTGQLKAWFINAQGQAQSFYPNRLPHHESVYAMTVHKSQGSEFEHVAMILPPFAQVVNNQVITKELIYTGVTRAKKHFDIYAEERVLEMSVRQTTQRSSGLAGLL